MAEVLGTTWRVMVANRPKVSFSDHMAAPVPQFMDYSLYVCSLLPSVRPR
jgi:hypothetical protein